MLTNLCKLACVLSLFAAVAGCGMDEGSTTGTGQDLATANVQDLAHAAVNDLAMSGTGGDGGLKALCATCANNNECASGMCLPYMGGATKKCSHSCTPATAAMDCPGVAMCNNMNPAVCKCQ
jgi:hypothetical protein